MSFSRNNNLIEDVENDLDPSNNGLNTIHPEPIHAIKIEESKSVGFETLNFTVYGSTPIRILGADPARIRALIATDSNNSVLIGAAATVTARQGMRLPNHVNGGLELTTTDELWASYDNASTTASQLIFIYIERQVQN
jgi:hypothetical protein